MNSKNPVLQPPPRPLAAAYEPKPFEQELYRFWEESGCFEAADENAPGQESFCIVIPPPNVTGVLHMGHALTNTIQDILTRWRRMSGDNALWLPGTDHAGIATQAQVERHLAKQKNAQGRPLSRHDLGRAKFLDEVWNWKEEHHSRIVGQLRRLGSSLDWKRERFTMDEGLSHAVREVFVRLYEEGLIYRGERIINWCTRCQTALSDLEVVPNERKGSLWDIRYDIVDEKGKTCKDGSGHPAFLTVATTRPETLLGDTAVAVHPDDERYRQYHGKFVKLPLLGKILPIVTDEYVDKEFGSGVVKITPAHDFNDYDVGQRHQLPIVSVMGKDGKISEEGGSYAGLKFSEAREKVLEDLKAGQQLLKTNDHTLKVGLCQRCDSVAEPLISKQWFVKIAPLAKPAIEAVESGKIEFVPKNWEKTYFEWMYNIRDWCISRQLWWGHQIPAWYCQRCEHTHVARENPKRCEKCKAPSSELVQDEDVLDTWFSSGLWPFSTLGWPDSTAALKTFYPTSILETGFDIIFFWVARMIMMGIHFLGDVPFRKVYLHAMVRDEKGEKMSKSKGNVIDPLVVIEEQGADPLRFTFAIMAGQGRDIKLSLDRVDGYRAFCNKIWNATRFFHFQIEQLQSVGQSLGQRFQNESIEGWITREFPRLLPVNRWMISRLQQVIAKTEKGLKDFELNVAAQAVYDFTWHEFCDWYIETSKLHLRESGARQEETLIVLHYGLEKIFTLLHPFIPFVTEELWQSLPWKKPANTPARELKRLPEVQTLMFQKFPIANSRLIDESVEQEMLHVQKLVDAIRNFRGENNISPKKEFHVQYSAASVATEQLIQSHLDEILSLSRASSLTSAGSREKSASEAVIPLPALQLDLRIDLAGLVDYAEEEKRVQKEIEKVKKDIEHLDKKLANESFTSKAPVELVNKEREKLAGYQSKLNELNASLARVSSLKK